MNALLGLLLLLQDSPLDRLILQLDSDVVEERDAAEKKLGSFGREALAPLEKAAGGDNAEVAVRARRALEGVRAQIAAEPFRDIEAALSRAQSLRIAVRFDWKRRQYQDILRFQGSGTLLFKKDRGVALKLSGRDEKGKPRTNIAVGDGTKVYLDLSSWWGNVLGTSASQETRDLRPTIAGPFARGGMEAAQDVWRHLSQAPDDKHPVSRFSETTGEDGTRILRYTLGPQVETERIVLLTYQPKPLKLLKREIRGNSKNFDVHYAETYDEFAFDAEIPDDAFLVPELPK